MSETNPNSRLEAFSDGVFAIALTLLIIDIKIPPTATINTSHDLWLALRHILPSLGAFLLSFVIILITWVNHHAALKFITKSSPPFIYANGLLLLSVVFIPFPTALLGEYVLTDHSSPAVILYSAVCGFQGFCWWCVTRTALRPNLLTKNEKGTLAVQQTHRYSYFGMSLYTCLAIVAVWFPRASAIAITLIWVFWLTLSINLNHE